MCTIHKSKKKKLCYFILPGPLSPSLSFTLISSLKLITLVSHLISEAHSLNSGLSSSTSPPPKLDVTDPPAFPSRRSASDPRCRSKCLLVVVLLVDIGYLTGKPMELADPPLLPTQLIDIMLVCDWWFFILFVIGDFVWWSGSRKKIGDWGFLFFFLFACCGLVVVVVAVGVVVVVADGRGGCGWCYGCLLGSGIYYFIVIFILFYCVES